MLFHTLEVRSAVLYFQRRPESERLIFDAYGAPVIVTSNALRKIIGFSYSVVLAGINEQEFDAGAVPEPSEPVYRAAAAGAVNIHPLAKTFQGLVPVSLDAPPPRPKRKGKQVRRS